MYIPKIGDVIKLTQNWTFNLWNERRNQSLIELCWPEYRKQMEMARNNSSNYWDWYSQLNKLVTLNSGVELKIERIYIKQNQEDFNSVTFRIKTDPSGFFSGKKKLRFWAKLDDVNNIEFMQVIP